MLDNQLSIALNELQSAEASIERATATIEALQSEPDLTADIIRAIYYLGFRQAHTLCTDKISDLNGTEYMESSGTLGSWNGPDVEVSVEFTVEHGEWLADNVDLDDYCLTNLGEIDEHYEGDHRDILREAVEVIGQENKRIAALEEARKAREAEAQNEAQAVS